MESSARSNVKIGATFKAAGRLAGVSEETIYEWRRRIVVTSAALSARRITPT